ncbi:unnamed protein product [Sphagnum jensenii]|uniref:Uncharacterized protein n=1 Tax=Sphagnum jensenii TaxID=128206 RepID=A0ABP1BVF2_9BRYO
MAVAAFKATTRSRRTCNIRGVEVEVPSTPHSRNTSPVRRSRPSSSPVKRMPSSSSTPRSRPASPTKQQQFANQNDRMHRRTRSFADLSSSRYFTDSSSLAVAENPGDCRSSSGLRSSAHHLPSGSESEAEPRSMRRSDQRRRDHGSDNEAVVHSSKESVQRNGHSKHSYRQPIGSLRRSMSQLDLMSEPSTPVYYRKGNVLKDESLQREDGNEVQVEEKTIRAVHTHTKVQTLCYNCLYDVSSEVSADSVSAGTGLKAKLQGKSMEPPSRETDAIKVYDVMRAEVRRAVAEAHSELKKFESKEPSGQSFSGDRNFQAISNDAWKVYAAKLEQSERKVQELWSQLAIEEQRCFDTVKTVKELVSRQQECLQTQRRSSLVLSDDKDIMRVSLDVEAQRYFEDCVSIEKLESLGVDCLMVSQERDVLSTENEEPFNWPVETDSDSVLCHADRQEVPQRPEHWRKSSSQNFGESLLVGKAAGKTKDCVPLDDEGMCLPWLEWEPEVDTLNRKEQVEKAAADLTEWKKAWAWKSVKWDKSVKRERGKDEGAVNVDEFLFERFQLRQRITQGRVNLCGGKR